MRFLYVSRLFNRSGYQILRHLLQQGEFVPVAVLVPDSIPRDEPGENARQELQYESEVTHYGCRRLRYFGSIRSLCDKAGVPICVRKTIKNEDSLWWLRSLSVDLAVLGGGWPELLPRRVLDLPLLGVLNTHPSLLPEFRGTDIHRWQTYKGVRRSGTTIHYVDENFDTGQIVGQMAVEIGERDTPQDLFEKTAGTAGPLMTDVLRRVASAAPARVAGEPQPFRHEKSCYFGPWPWHDSNFLHMDWSMDARKLDRLVLACSQESYKYNGPFFRYHDRKYIVRQARFLLRPSGDGVPGSVQEVGRNAVVVRCGGDNGVLALERIQPCSSTEWWPDVPHAQPAVSPMRFAAVAHVQVGSNLSEKG